ncbi:hypothetical protein L1857_25640 [Amycolatopsis thermalba]|uniref:Uncharacterized protein n=1 Tax=Amycolatopsis thermalba TaxID=944492 RepID=A0ABY4P0T5_9PSEU|nr:MULTISPECIES: transcriptional regulator [Amycolatopsis]UQS25950.1 hypothetical protein L1857_25640 [Amycolatopsis thermalba]
MTDQSLLELPVLHAVRLLGFANSRAVAERAGTNHDEALRVLRESERAGWVQHGAFADIDGWSEDVVAAVYREFLPLNARLLRAVTDWQIKPAGTDRFAPNGHSDRAYRSALRKARSGQHNWIGKTDVDSCHRVWFQLHEDLVATLGIDRLTESQAPK